MEISPASLTPAVEVASPIRFPFVASRAGKKSFSLSEHFRKDDVRGDVIVEVDDDDEKGEGVEEDLDDGIPVQDLKIGSRAADRSLP